MSIYIQLHYELICTSKFHVTEESSNHKTSLNKHLNVTRPLDFHLVESGRRWFQPLNHVVRGTWYALFDLWINDVMHTNVDYVSFPGCIGNTAVRTWFKHCLIYSREGNIFIREPWNQVIVIISILPAVHLK